MGHEMQILLVHLGLNSQSIRIISSDFYSGYADIMVSFLTTKVSAENKRLESDKLKLISLLIHTCSYIYRD